MPMRVNLSTQVDIKTAEWLALDAKQKKMKISPYIREVLDAHLARQQKTEPVQKSS